MKKIKALLVVVCTGVLLTACSNPSQKGVEYLEDGKYDQAIEQFEQAVDKKKKCRGCLSWHWNCQMGKEGLQRCKKSF